MPGATDAGGIIDNVTPAPGKILHVSDTALMVAACRASETNRPDGLIQDPYAERLGSERGAAILRELPMPAVMCFGIGVRSLFMDQLVRAAVEEHGVRTVVSLGSGLDTRPWRLGLPADARWIEVDFPEMLDYKHGLMAGVTPSCRVERLSVDLNDTSQRERLWAAAGAENGLLITEGLLQYLPASTVEAIAIEAASAGMRFWLTDITSPAFAAMISMRSYHDVESMRAADALDGLKILDVVRNAGWSNAQTRSYLTDMWAIPGERIRELAAMRDASKEPPPAVPPDDPTGVHLWQRG